MLDIVDAFILDNISESLRVEHLASLVYMSRFHFSREFKKLTKMTPTAFIMKKRIDMVVAMLKSGVPISHAAVECGFSSQAHLTKAFKALTGQTPGEFRRSQQSIPPLSDQQEQIPQ